MVMHIERDFGPDTEDHRSRCIVVVEDHARGAILFEVTMSAGHTTAVLRAFEDGEPVAAAVLSLDGTALLSL